MCELIFLTHYVSGDTIVCFKLVTQWHQVSPNCGSVGCNSSRLIQSQGSGVGGSSSFSRCTSSSVFVFESGLTQAWPWTHSYPRLAMNFWSSGLQVLGEQARTTRCTGSCVSFHHVLPKISQKSPGSFLLDLKEWNGVSSPPPAAEKTGKASTLPVVPQTELRLSSWS